MPPTHRCATVLAVPSYLLRIELVDRPGSLGSLAVALGSVGADILSLIHDVHARFGSTVVMVTHDEKVAKSCERTLTIRDGRIVDDVVHRAA